MLQRPLLASLFVLTITALPLQASELTAAEVAERVNARPDGDSVVQDVELVILDARGRSRRHALRAVRKDAEGLRYSRLVFEEPRLLAGSGTLAIDYPGDRSDDQWVYLTADRRARRISSGGRSDSFFGSEFDFEDVKNGARVNYHEYVWERVLERDENGLLGVEYRPRNDELIRDLGYSRARMWVDTERWLPLRFEFWDRQGNPSRALSISDVREVDGVWTPHVFEATNLKNQRRSVLTLSEVRYGADLEDALFAQSSLGRPLP